MARGAAAAAEAVTLTARAAQYATVVNSSWLVHRTVISISSQKRLLCQKKCVVQTQHFVKHSLVECVREPNHICYIYLN